MENGEGGSEFERGWPLESWKVEREAMSLRRAVIGESRRRLESWRVERVTMSLRGEELSSVNCEVGEKEESWTAELRALVRVYERMLKGEAGEKDEQVEEVTCKMIVGRGLACVRRKVLSEFHELTEGGCLDGFEITGSFPAVRKELSSVSSCVQDSPREDAANSNVTKPPGMMHHGNPMPASVEPFHQRGYAPGFHLRGYSSGLGPEIVGAHNRIYFEEDVLFKLLCHLDKLAA
ncbi:hypothetical protein Patl1_22269 [Pistacia atlantica]|uniref:Uncharacterized protein n=1 Tax=Pistacia atlantica TaxID=434234 RepID=A0ACC1BIQ9_9ROSI|nr:hypothetical protein Patl1_22269 [Pistacia atlantica]